MQGHSEKAFKPASTLTESELTTVIDRLMVAKPGLRKPEVLESKPSQPVTRAKLLVVLARCHVSLAEIDAIENAASMLSAYSDASDIPEWATKPIAYAVSRRIAPLEPSVRPNATVTRSELAGMLAACLGVFKEEPANATGYTGLIVDCRGIDVKRCMSVTLKDEAGNQIYPDLKNLPPDDIMMDEGMVSFSKDPENAKRSGERPYIISAMEVSGKAGSMLKLSNDDCAALLAAEKTDRFLAKWKVTILVGPAPKKEEPVAETPAPGAQPQDTSEKLSEASE
jgi:hypothetical protein